MRYSSAVPTVALEHFSPVLDFDYVLAHIAQRDRKYSEFYAKQKAKGRYVLLDNGFHETGNPLSVPELLEICKAIQPSAVIAPDWFGKPKETLQGFDLMKKTLTTANLPNRIGVATVMQGNDFAERAAFFEHVRTSCDVLCFPFRADRYSWFMEMLDRIPQTTQWPPRIHLLGMSSFRELKLWRGLLDEYKNLESRITFDTTKPLKYALLEKRLSDFKADESLRGRHETFPQRDQKEELKPLQWMLAYYNVAYLRRFI